MGLYLQRDQEVPPKPQFRLARPLCGDYDRTIHGCLCTAAHTDMPQKRRACNGEYRWFS